MQISERLNLVADFVPACQTAADIGTDHGYIPIELTKPLGSACTAVS